MIETYKELIDILLSDSYRYKKNNLIKNLLIPGFRYTFWLRICQYLLNRHSFLYHIANLFLRHYKYKYGIEISPKTEIGKGLYIGHFGGIVVNAQTKIGKNVNLSHNVTIGANNRGKHKGVPIIKDYVYIAPGAKIIGNITIGNHVAIGANAVVLDDVPDGVSIAGIPAKIVSHKGSDNDYIQNPIH